MEIFAFSESGCKEKWLAEIKKQDWSAAGFLYGLLTEKRFYETLGDAAELFIMAEGDRLVSFATLAPKDEIDDDSLKPWIGFVYTAPEYRGRRLSGRLISRLCESAGAQGYKKVYLSTDHIGLYEKYDFIYMEDRKTIWGEESRIYYRNLQERTTE